MFLILFSACSRADRQTVDRLNDISYAYHYRNLDSTAVYAKRALQAADDYNAGKAEALNNLAFVSIMRMDYANAYEQLARVHRITNNQIELFIADVQQMRLCQRESRNKEFYDHREHAIRCQRRIDEEREMLSERENKRLLYAQSEFAIVTSTYYYYVGLEQPSIDAISNINADELESDTAQYLSYLYNIGAGGIITQGTQDEINQSEFDSLMRCYLLATQANYPFWEANSMQAISEHLFDAEARRKLIANNLPASKFINPEELPDSLLAGYLAQKSLDLFRNFGDVYQTAGAYRTLASSYVAINDYRSALNCLHDALETDTLIEQAPDLVASIHEQLSVAYSAIDDKPDSDHHRNVYLDQQEETRQDRQLEARAEQLERSSRQLNVMLVAVIIMILAVAALICIFDRLRRRSDKKNSMEQLLQPLEEWRKENDRKMELLNDRYEEVNENYAISLIHIQKNKKRNLENRAKVFLVNSIMPFIDRMIHEVRRLETHDESEEKRQERYEYLVELTDKINDYNDVLTQWIQLRQGELSLHIESFYLQSLFNTVQKSRMAFQLKGITLNVEPTEAVVKADRVLTLFMINTMADNARKFTPKGGQVTIEATETPDYVEISIADTGEGMGKEELENVFTRKVIVDSGQPTTASHGFGLMNCKGIIEKYRKISQIFSVCQIAAESRKGQGSRFSFRLPKGMMKVLILLLGLVPSLSALADVQVPLLRAAQYADSAYYSNLEGTFARTLQHADSVRRYVNQAYHALHPESADTLLANGSPSAEPPEVRWFHDGVEVNYDVILDIRNETAIAALALHEWALYRYNNKVYTQLFKEQSADTNLGAYCSAMQKSETNKTVAIIILVLLLILLFPAYYLLYYRHRVYYRFCLERVQRINSILLTDDEPKEKLQLIEKLSSEKFPPVLLRVVDQIKHALRESIALTDERQTDIELAEDECRRAEYENEKLHISNSVLDNCLSTLKHETMYYPSRIRQLVDGTDSHLTAISELVVYYKELYALLSEQSMRQVDAVKNECKPVPVADILPQSQSTLKVLGDKDMLSYLFDILRQQSGQQQLQVEVAGKDDHYVSFRVLMPSLNLSAEACADLFTPSMAHLPYLLCRQIVRDHSQLTARRGCGMRAEPHAGGGTDVIVTLSRG